MSAPSEKHPGAAAPDPNGGTTNPEPGANTGGEGSAPTAPAQAGPAPRAAKQQDHGSDSPEVDRWFAKGARAGKREVYEEVEKDHGVPLRQILDEWRGYRDAAAKGEKVESAELTKLQRQLAHVQEQVKIKDTQINAQSAEINGYKVTQPIVAAVRRVGPRSERYESILVSEVARRVKLDDDGELTVLSVEGKPLHKSTIDDLVKEVAESMPELVNPPRAGTGVKPAAPAIQSAGPAPSGAGYQQQRADRVSAIQRVWAR